MLRVSRKVSKISPEKATTHRQLYMRYSKHDGGCMRHNCGTTSNTSPASL